VHVKCLTRVVTRAYPPPALAADTRALIASRRVRTRVALCPADRAALS
jgi:hypothetical protein